MGWLAVKYAITALLVVIISEVARLNDRIGGLIAALPLVTVLALIWLYLDGQPTQKIANHAFYTFWYVIPTLPMFLAFPALLPHLGFWLTLLVCMMLTVALFFVFALVLKPFGILLM